MPRRRKHRPARPDARQGRPAHGSEGAVEIGHRIVEDPYDPDNLITVPANLRHDPLLRMFSRREIDNAQLLAGESLRKAHEAASHHGIKAIDPFRDVVDGGRPSIGIPEAALHAACRLREAQLLLGWQAYRLVVCVACDGLNGSLIAESTSARLDRNVVQFQLRSSLEQLAVLWGFASDPKRVRRQASIVGTVRERAGWLHDETELAIRYSND